MGEIIHLSDKLVNLAANLGTARDKATGSFYALTLLDEVTLSNAYRSAWLPRKIVDAPAQDACREWRKWYGANKQIEKIEAYESRLNLIYKMQDALIKSRLFGGAAIYIGTNDKDVSKPLLPERMGAEGIKYLTVISRRQMSAGELDRDVRSPTFNTPLFYTLGDTATQIHPSRLVILNGAKLPDESLASGNENGWGDSVLQHMLETLQQNDGTMANVASLIFEAKIDVFSIPGFMDGMASENYRSKVVERFQLAAMMKGNNGALLLDKNETFDQKTTSFANLGELIDRFKQAVSGAADIPVTRLFGETTGGLGGNGEENTRNYYDRIKSDQRLVLSPAMATLDECLIRSALGSRPKGICYQWAGLWQPTAATKSEIGLRTAQTFQILADTQLLPAEVLAKGLVTTLVESGDVPGLESAMDDYLKTHSEDDPNSDPIITDAAPRTLYVSRKVVNRGDLEAWAKVEGFTLADNLHVTIAYSKTPVDWMAMGSTWSAAELDAGTGGARMMDNFGTEGQYKVLMFNCGELAWRNREMVEAGASWDWPDYQPHITVSEDPNLDIATITPYRGKITLGPEIFEEIRAD